ncbi:hypothetical protein TIFTF001_055804 [Ficus carica]|uniref:Secreted protein n=1 Tax=Ficus carica TaxID=3494 RepID=A0AA88JJ93_FICCA|nr:hypothetical protein TIFTF001_055804 [Ficus carica]
MLFSSGGCTLSRSCFERWWAFFLEMVVLAPDADGSSPCVSRFAIRRHLVGFAACSPKRSSYSNGPFVDCTFTKRLAAVVL